MSAQQLTRDTIDIIDPGHYQRNGYPHDEWALLRREAPVYWFGRTRGVPFWAITKHADIVALSKQPRILHNEPRLALFPDEEEASGGVGDEEGRHLLTMDPPMHGQYRRLISSQFTPRAVRAKADDIDRIAREILDEISPDGESGETDFVLSVASVLPIAVIAEMLGVPRADWKLMFQWTNEMIGANDPEYRREGETADETSERARLAALEYFAAMAEDRRKQPRDDIVSVLANAKVDDEPMPFENLMSFFNLIVIAGNEPTRNATSGRLLALIENPDELEKLRRDPSLIPSAVEEIVRWTTPVIQFCRTATQDIEIRDTKVRQGEAFCLFYPSANRDEDVFETPNEFRIDRDPNPHIGIGEHFCLGAYFARMELTAVFRNLIARLDHVELIGPVERLRSSLLGGVKHMPIRYRLRAA
jgi:cholest-4-en-3-one 26-monooxygenase